MANSASRLFKELTDEEIKKIMARHIPGAEISGYSLCHGGLFNTTYRVDFGNAPSVILRVGPIRRELLMGYEHDMMRTEEEIFRRMQKAKIPCSEVLCVSTERELVDRDYMIVSCIESVPLSSAELSQEERYRIDRECGRLLRMMHAIPCESFGRATDVLSGKRYANFFESIRAEIADLTERSRKDGFFTFEECERVRLAIERHRALLENGPTPVLCHGDMWSGNVLVEKRGQEHTLAAIIDVDRAYFGDVDFDLGNPWILSDAFLEGYGINREALEVRERKIKRTVAATVYFLIEAYVWHAQYNGEANAQNGKRAAFEMIHYLETVPID